MTDDNDATVSIIAGALGSLGDRVWLDSNANGVQNAGEPGIVGVKVNLTGDFDMNGTIDYTASMTTGR
ncbi:MAG: SdrD B-like domain-containing protein [Planctomycetaceae bacterium]